jgi:C-methyltransferase-like protein/putative zinc binding protein/methyltransferase family protein
MSKCRICKSDRLTRFLDLGNQPHCNRFLKKEELNGPENFYPLDLFFCSDCALVQMVNVVPAEVMFKDHPYVSGTTATLSEHFRNVAKEAIDTFHVPSNALVVDIGSNDGTFLKGFSSFAVRTLGVEPAAKIAKLATDAGIPTVNDFFSSRVATEIRKQHGPAKIINAAGVFFHVDDLDDFVLGVRQLLDDDGVFVVQAIYLVDMIERNSFDNVYHEHVCHYSIKPLDVLFDRFDMEIFDVHRVPIHGGSIVAHVGKKGRFRRTAEADRLKAEEKVKGLHDLKRFQEFATKAAQIKTELVSTLRDLKSKGKRIAAYGAPAKGNTLLNYCQIGPDILDYAVEKNPLKCGMYSPGMHIPVITEQEASERVPDYFLLLPWNFGEELLAKEKDYRSKGGKFIIPIPEPRIV